LAGTLVMVFLLLLLDLFTYKDITEKVDLDLLLMLACALTLGNAMVSTGAAKQIADGVLHVFAIFGNQGLLVGIYFLTLFLTAFLTNAAAVSIAFPIAYSLSQQIGIEGTPFFMAIVFAASGDFMTPIGYQTNLMVYNAGGYKPSDFLRVGFPMTVIYTVISIAIILFRYKL
jgi:di/tricarboxylate transporter